MGKSKDKWIQSMSKSIKKRHTEGSLRKQMKVKEGEKIPLVFLNKIIDAEIGARVTNPSSVGIKSIIVTELLKKRANAAANLIRISRRRKK